MNNYEGIFILDPALSKEAQEKMAAEIKDVMVKNKGEVKDLQNWGKRKLAYRLKKQNEGVYFFSEFKIIPGAVKKIEGIFKLNDSILRTLIIRKDSI